MARLKLARHVAPYGRIGAGAVVGALAVLSATAVAVFAATHPSPSTATPAGWIVAGTRPQDYEAGVDPAVTDSGKPTARLRATVADPAGFVTLMQSISADRYRGQRVRFVGDIRVSNVVGWSALWMRVDGPCMRILAFDNAEKRAARGTTTWAAQPVVLDVPRDAEGISFGVLQSGKGEAWVSGLRLEPVADTVPLTNMIPAPTEHSCGPSAPVNLALTPTGR
ncbi:MAG: transcriptional regulator [Gemmatimonadaceae bacterium]